MSCIECRVAWGLVAPGQLRSGLDEMRLNVATCVLKNMPFACALLLITLE